MIHVGITGGTGLVGPHLTFLFDAHTDKFTYILIGREDFVDLQKLQKKLEACDIVVHLAGLSNRANQEEIYSTNIGLTKFVLDSLRHRPKVIFLSSVHRDKGTPYGRSKKDSELLIDDWAKKNNAKHTIIVSPHIFGESPHIFDRTRKLYTNSAFATFCYELISNKPSTVYPIAPIELIHVGDVVSSIFDVIQNTSSEPMIFLYGTKTQMADVYALLKYFRDEYSAGRVPTLKDDFESNCYKTFLSYA